MSDSNCCFLTCIQFSQEAGKVVWYSHLFKNFPQFVVVHTVKGFSIVNEAEVGVFLLNEIKRCLLLGRKAMTNLDSLLESRNITLLVKVQLVKARFKEV